VTLRQLLIDAGWFGEAALVAVDSSHETLAAIAVKLDAEVLSARWTMPLERARNEAARLAWGDGYLAELVRRRPAIQCPAARQKG
jgi:hypothetical protein